MRFTLDQLHAFVTVARLGHFGQAAEHLSLSQPSVSRLVQGLEQALGFRLLERTPSGSVLTPEGEYFLQRATDTVEDALAAEALAARVGRAELGTVSIAFTSILGNELIASVVKDLSNWNPELELVLREMPTAEQPSALRDGSIDIGLARPVGAGVRLTAREIRSSPLALALPRSWGIEDGSSVPAHFLEGRDFIAYSSDGPSYFRDLVAGLLDRRGVRPRIRQRVVQVYTMLNLVGAGVGAAIVPASARNWLPADAVLVDSPLVAGWSSHAVLSYSPSAPRLVQRVAHRLVSLLTPT